MESVAIEIRSGTWGIPDIEGFLRSSVIPMRLATQGSDWPLVQSLWFLFDDSALWCCTQKDSVVAARLRKEPRCAFEIAGDAPPYRGVRGRGVASLDAGGAANLLDRLIGRYLTTGDAGLGAWLRSRVSDEVAIRIGSLRVSSWDYSSRMKVT
ncbi:MAG: pyridoxamine 5'-phosphate oxidase family protein [Dehalococcoidia bacterium]